MKVSRLLWRSAWTGGPQSSPIDHYRYNALAIACDALTFQTLISAVFFPPFAALDVLLFFIAVAGSCLCRTSAVRAMVHPFLSLCTLSFLANAYQLDFVNNASAYVMLMIRFHIKTSIASYLFSGKKLALHILFDVLALAGLSRMYSAATPALVSLHCVGMVFISILLFASATTINELMIRLHDQTIALQAARDAAVEAARDKSILVATVSHEIRTPLHAVLASVSTLKEAHLDPYLQEFAQVAYTSAVGLLSLVNGILDMERMNAGKMDLERREFNLRDMVDNVVDMCVVSVGETKTVRIIAVVDHTVPAIVVADETRLQQLLLNLAGNATKFTSFGEVVIRVSNGPSNSLMVSDELSLLIEVSDTGIGMSEDQQTRLFQPFIQASSAVSRKYGGTGLGLAIARQIALLMRGDIKVRSTLGVGTTFSVNVILNRRGPNTRRRSSISVELATNVPSSRRRNQSIAIMSPSASLRDSLSEILHHMGYTPQVISHPDDLHNMQGCVLAAVLVDNIAYHDDIQGRNLRTQTLIFAVQQEWPDARVLTISERETHYIATPPELKIGYTLLYYPVRLHKLHEALHGGISMRNFNDAGLSTCLPVSPLRLQLATAQHRTEASNFSTTVPFSRRSSMDVPPLDAKKILVVDDNKVNQMLAKRILQRSNYHVVIAGNGEEALAALDKEMFDLVLMDCYMPEMNGYDAAIAIRNRSTADKDIAIVALTAGGTQEENEKCFSSGMNGLLQKPYTAAQLLSTVVHYAE